MNKIIILRHRINDVVLSSIREVAIIWIRISCESRVNKSEDIYNTKVSG